MKKLIWIVNSIFFLLFLYIGATAFWLFPKQTISNTENRSLTQFPVISIESVFSGKFEKIFEQYYDDHFPFRESWLEISSLLNSLRGSLEQEIRVVNLNSGNFSELENIENTDTEVDITEEIEINNESDKIENNLNPLIVLEKNNERNQVLPTNITPLVVDVKPNQSEMRADNILSDSLEVATRQEIETNKPKKDNDISENSNLAFSKIKGVIITNGRVLQVFAGSEKSISPYINMLNKFREKLPTGVAMYSMIVPSGSDFYLPHRVNKGILKEQDNLRIAKQLLSSKIIDVPAYDVLLNHKKEYIYFRTDHHWTGLGAYYAYTAFASQAGFEPLALDEMKFIRKDKTFLGSLYNYTKDHKLKESADNLEYYKVPTKSLVKIYQHKNLKESFEGVLYAEKNNSYLLFLQGDYPLIYIKTPASRNKKIVIIKDSFANAFVPYLTAHYSDIYVIDYRYFKGDLFNLIKQNGINEVLYTHNTFAANSAASVKFGNLMLGK